MRKISDMKTSITQEEVDKLVEMFKNLNASVKEKERNERLIYDYQKASYWERKYSRLPQVAYEILEKHFDDASIKCHTI